MENEKVTLLVDDSSLKPLRARPNLRSYLVQLWKRRHFIYFDARSKSLRTGSGTFLGVVWVVLEPLLQVLVYALVFGLILRTGRGIENFVGFLVLGVIYFRFMTAGMSGGVRLIQNSRAVISSFDFPRAALVLSTTVRQFFDNIAPAVVAIVIALSFQTQKGVTPAILFVIPLFFLLHLFAHGLSLISARLTALIPDSKALISLLQRALFFVSGIFYDISRFDGQLWLQKIMEANPFFQFLTAVRSCVLDGELPESATLLALVLWTGGILVIGFLFFWEAEEKYARVR